MGVEPGNDDEPELVLLPAADSSQVERVAIHAIRKLIENRIRRIPH